MIERPGPSRLDRGTAGGGGYGDPLARSPEAVARDAAEGWVSRERAAEVYGVVVGDDGQVDLDQTARRRDEGGAG